MAEPPQFKYHEWFGRAEAASSLGLLRELAMDDKPIDRRKSRRFHKISLMQADSYLIGETLDLSMGGARFRVHRSLSVDTPVKLDLAADDLVLEIQAKVIRVSRIAQDRYEIGLEFEPLAKPVKAALRQFLSRQARWSSSPS